MAGKLAARVAGALTNVRNPRVENDIISAGMVEELSVTDDGVVSFTFVLSREDPAGLVRAARQVLKAVDGVTDVKIRIIEPRALARGLPQDGARRVSAWRRGHRQIFLMCMLSNHRS